MLRIPCPNHSCGRTFDTMLDMQTHHFDLHRRPDPPPPVTPFVPQPWLVGNGHRPETVMPPESAPMQGHRDD
jgi:hypothetical protein